MRIISGSWRGQSLKIPRRVRPTTDRVKEAIFSILGDAWNLDVLDLYAGSGGLGLEALSRGARSAHFVDVSRYALHTIKDNLHGKEPVNVTLSQQDALDFLRATQTPCDWIFCDPPYDKVNYTALLRAISESKALTSHTLLILESDRYHAFDLPPELSLIDQRKFGDTVIYFIKRSADDDRSHEQRA